MCYTAVMKAYFWMPFVCLLGVLVGAWGPRAEIRAMKQLEVERKSRPRNAAAEGFKAFVNLANIPSEAKRTHRHRAKDRPLFVGGTNQVARASAGMPPGTVAPEAAASEDAGAKQRGPLPPEDLRARIEEAQDLWRTRVVVARANWLSRLKLTGEEAARFDVAIEEMNDQLHETMLTMVQLVGEKDKVPPELGLRLVGDATTIMAETYEKVAACVPETMREVVSEMPMTDFIDPGVAEPLIAVQDKFENFGGARP